MSGFLTEITTNTGLCDMLAPQIDDILMTWPLKGQHGGHGQKCVGGKYVQSYFEIQQVVLKETVSVSI